MSSELMKRFEGGCDASTVIMNWAMLNTWLQPYSVSIPPLVTGYRTAMRIGDVEHACSSFTLNLSCGLLSGLSLKTLVGDAENHIVTVNDSCQRVTYGRVGIPTNHDYEGKTRVSQSRSTG